MNPARAASTNLNGGIQQGGYGTVLALQIMTGRLAQGERVAQSLCSSNSAAFYLMNIQFLLMPWRAAPKKPQSLKTRDSALQYRKFLFF